MKQLTRAAQAKAREFIFSQARPIEQALFGYYFEGGTAVSPKTKTEFFLQHSVF